MFFYCTAIISKSYCGAKFAYIRIKIQSHTNAHNDAQPRVGLRQLQRAAQKDERKKIFLPKIINKPTQLSASQGEIEITNVDPFAESFFVSGNNLIEENLETKITLTCPAFIDIATIIYQQLKIDDITLQKKVLPKNIN